MSHFYSSIFNSFTKKQKLLAILIDPEKFDTKNVVNFLSKIPKTTTHLFVGGSTTTKLQTEETVTALKKATQLPIFLFPGDADHISKEADGILFLSLISGNNPEYLIKQQIKSVPVLKESSLEIIPTGYVLIDGETESAVARVSNTKPLPQNDIQTIVHTALAGQYIGKKLIYLEAGSGAKNRVSNEIIQAVSEAINIPLIVGGGIQSEKELKEVYDSGATLVVIGTAFEMDNYNHRL
ncbi:MAG: geranylgeranylglyceryl/heptaprenylglyceryl phosphate synthase [Flavobacteriaceae bacterium]